MMVGLQRGNIGIGERMTNDNICPPILLKYRVRRRIIMFYCDKCGLCCMHINESSFDNDMDRGDGVCRFFDDKTHLCKIYSERPIFCNVDKFYEEYFKDKYSIEEYYSVNYESCKKLKERYGVESDFWDYCEKKLTEYFK